jgi:hypothetical protein
MKRILALIVGSVASLVFTNHTQAGESEAEMPYFAVCSADLAGDHALYLKMKKNAEDQFWTVMTREYNPTTGDDYVRDDTQTAAARIIDGTFAIHFNESSLELKKEDMDEPCFKATLVQDGDSAINLVCSPYGVRVRCRN